MSKNSKLEFERMDRIERRHAARSGIVFSEALKGHLARGHDVVIARGDAIVRLTPDGASHFVKQIAPPRQLGRGSKFRLR